MANMTELLECLKDFTQFVCEGKKSNADLVLNSTLSLMKYCPSARDAVLQFYAQLFDEYVLQYITHGKDPSLSSEHSFLFRLKKSDKKSAPSTPMRKASVESRKLSTENPDDEASNTPASPPPINQIEPIEEPTEEESNEDDGLDQLISRIGDSLLELVVPLKNEDGSSLRVGSWALELLSTLCAKNASKRLIAASTEKFSETITFWRNCAVTSLLLDLILKALEQPSGSSEFEAAMQAFIRNSPYTDWTCAYIITAIPEDSGALSFANCVETLIRSSASPQSVTSILSHLSERNPRAIINSSRNNIPFLLQLCASSKPLLDLLSVEAIKEVKVFHLNELSLTFTDEMVQHILYCAINAPNAFDLLLLGFAIVTDKEASEKVRAQTLVILTAVVNKLHEHVHGSSQTARFDMPIMGILNVNIEKLITLGVLKGNVQLRKLQLRLLHILCVHFGEAFTCTTLHVMLCSLKSDGSSKNNLSESQAPHPILASFLRSLRLSFGSDLDKLFISVVKLSHAKNTLFWTNLSTIVEAEDSFEMDIDITTEHFIKEFQEIDSCDETLFYILKVISCCMEKFPKQISKPKHLLCLTLVGFYVQLVKDQEEADFDSAEFDLKTQLIVMTQKTMSTLARKQITNQHILCRALLESVTSWGAGAPRDFRRTISWLEVNLKEENIKYGGLHSSFQFRKMPLNPLKKSNLFRGKNSEKCMSNITNQLLLDAIRSCVVDMATFAFLLVECVTPDVMFNDLPWPDEDFLKVTIERDLYIARMFETHPILWDFCDLIGAAGFLYNCSVLVRALMAVQLTQWASATAAQNKVDSAQKLIKLVTKGGLIPEIPFKYLPPILPKLGSWETFCVLNDIWRYMKDNSSSVTSSRLSAAPIRPYLERLRVIMAQNIPGPLYVKIFKGLV